MGRLTANAVLALACGISKWKSRWVASAPTEGVEVDSRLRDRSGDRRGKSWLSQWLPLNVPPWMETTGRQIPYFLSFEWLSWS